MTGRTRVKFCGITRPADAARAEQLGADFVGLIRVPESPRFIPLTQAAIIRARLSPQVQVVTLFRNAGAAEVRAAIAALRPDLLQFHGDEPPEFCGAFGLPYWRAVPMATGQDLAQWSERFAGAAALLLDGHAAGGQGGQGRTFDWSAARGARLPLVLAGGLTADNVAQAVQQVRPYAVDVSSGVESAPGVKDATKMERFVKAVRDGDAA